MDIQINNQTKTYQFTTLSLQELLDLERPHEQRGIAVAIDHKVIPKTLWAEHIVQHGDSILIITATQGG